MNYLSLKSRTKIYDQADSILKVEGLKTYFKTKTREVKAVDGVSFELHKGETLGIVGESGSGKSVTMLSILQLIENPGKVMSGSAIYCDSNTCTDLLSLPTTEIAKYRGNKIGIIYQQAISAFNPIRSIGHQLREAILIHNKSAVDLDKTLITLLLRVDLGDPERILSAYPHQLSGGQLQRCMIAMAIVNKPNILIADEPTTGLDVITQKSVINLLKELKDELDMSMIFISHDLGVIADIASNVLVMKKGLVVEVNNMIDLFENPKTNYTKALLNCRPSIDQKSKRLPTYQDLDMGLDLKDESFKPLSNSEIEERKNYISHKPILLETQGLSKSFNVEMGLFRSSERNVEALKNVSLNIRQEEILGIVGESGSGKSTLAKIIARLEPPSSGTISFQTNDLLSSNGKALREFRKKIQIIFQDVTGSLDPKMNVEKTLDMVLSIHFRNKSKQWKNERTITLLEQVGLSKNFLHRLPHELSGGERQRICIARAIAVEPSLLICDECVSALDVSIQAQILNLLLDLRDELGLSILFISHDLSVINFMCDRVLIMRSGEILEQGYPQDILKRPKENYTKKLIAAIPNA